MYPLKKWLSHRRTFGFGDIYPQSIPVVGGQKHRGTDILTPVGLPIYAHTRSKAVKSVGAQSGNMVTLTGGGYAIRLMHLDRVGKLGNVEEGDIIGYTGNTGLSTAPHVHIDVSKGSVKLNQFSNFVDPESFFMPKQYRILLLVNHAYDSELLNKRLTYTKEFYRKVFGGDLELTIDVKRISTTTQWADEGGTVLSRRYVEYNLIPYASGYDVCVFWSNEWKTSYIGYSQKELYLGVHFIALGSKEHAKDPRFVRFDGSEFVGVLTHELGHALYQRTQDTWILNETDRHLKGHDNTHYFDYHAKDLSLIEQDIEINKLKGWDTPYTKMYRYAGEPTTKKKPFSGEPQNGKVYRSSDNRMYFRYQDRWIIIGESEYADKSKSGMFGEMAVEEANYIYAELLAVPPRTFGSTIIQRNANNTVEKMLYTVMGFKTSIPAEHLL